MSDELNGVTATDAPANASQAQTTTLDPHIMELVNQQVEQRVSERLANLDTTVERRVQGEIQKRKNQAEKQFNDDKRAIERMKQRGAIDDKQADDMLADAEAEKNRSQRIWHSDDEAPAQPAPDFSKTGKTPVGVNTVDEAKQAIREYLADFGLTEKDVPLEEFLVNVETAEQARALDRKLRQAVNKAKEAKATKLQEQRRQRADEQDAQQVVDALESTGGIGGMSGAPGTPAAEHTNRATLDDAHDWYDVAHEELWGKGGGQRRG